MKSKNTTVAKDASVVKSNSKIISKIFVNLRIVDSTVQPESYLQLSFWLHNWVFSSLTGSDSE